MIHDYLVAIDQILFHAFCVCDENESRKLSLQEMEIQLKKLNLFDNIDPILKILQEIDKNGNQDGIVYYEDFLYALHLDFNQVPQWFWNDCVN